jgi:hypothetical protein
MSTGVSFTIYFKWAHKKVTRVKSGERAGDKTGQLRPIEEAIDKMQLYVVDPAQTSSSKCKYYSGHGILATNDIQLTNRCELVLLNITQLLTR